MPDPDYKYQSVLAARFIGRLNFCGKKMTGERIFYTALKLIQDKMKEEPLAVFTRAIENVRPLLEVRPRRVGGATYQVPQEVRPERGATRSRLASGAALRGGPFFCPGSVPRGLSPAGLSYGKITDIV